MDSSALGLLLVFKQYMDVKDGEVILINLNEHVFNVVKTANFDRLFKIK